MKKALWVLAVSLILIFPAGVRAEPPRLDEETLQLCNQVMLHIFDSIVSMKDKYPELEGFDETVLTKNMYGIYEIVFENKNLLSVRKDAYYRFHLTIVGTNDNPYAQEKEVLPVSLNFPVLGLKFAGYQARVGGSRLNLSRVVENNSQPMYDHQQKYIPLNLTLIAEKEVYRTNERINFKVVLKNSGSQNLKVKNFNEYTLFFTIDNKIWGTQPEQAKSGEDRDSKDVVIAPGHTISRGFKGDSFDKPRDVEIMCTYNMAYKGVLPKGSIKIKIVKGE